MDLQALNMQSLSVCAASSGLADQPPQFVKGHCPFTAAGISHD